MENQGWIGIVREVKHALTTVGADKDENGLFLVTGTLATFLGLSGDDAEIVIGADAKYYVNGEPCSLVALMRSTSYGLGITVI